MNLPPTIESLTAAVTGRERSLFQRDIDDNESLLSKEIQGRDILIAGGAGSIGSAVVMELMRYGPDSIVVIDPDENALAELIRMSNALHPSNTQLMVEPLDYGSDQASAFVDACDRCDVVMSFAAYKHVRTDRSADSLLRMLEVNVLGMHRFIQASIRRGHGRRCLFSVSTDKAAQPVTLMGASKRAMEAVLWLRHFPESERVTTARFPNVAFSEGSLPWSYLQRLRRRQPLVAPLGVKRHLISIQEAAHLCLLAAFVIPTHHILVPTVDDRQVVSFVDIATKVVEAHGLRPKFHRYGDLPPIDELIAKGAYPVVFTEPTDGEKTIEVFTDDGQAIVDVGLSQAGALTSEDPDVQALQRLFNHIAMGQMGVSLTMEDLVEALRGVVPNLGYQHQVGLTLDQRM